MIEDIQRCFQTLDAAAVKDGALRELYGEDAVFIDPFHRIHGRDALEAYFIQLYRNVQEISFTYGATVSDGDTLMMSWEMTLRHPRLRRGQAITLSGITHFTLRDGLIVQHHDYFDAGAMVYENLPVIGGVIQWIKGKMGK